MAEDAEARLGGEAAAGRGPGRGRGQGRGHLGDDHIPWRKVEVPGRWLVLDGEFGDQHLHGDVHTANGRKGDRDAEFAAGGV